MNYANMIEEKHLKKGFIVATLVSTLVGTFSASMALADKIQEKHDRHKQKATDGKQDGQIKVLEEKLKKLEASNKDEREGDRGGDREGNRRRRFRDDYDDDEYFAYSARRSRAMIEQAYQDNLMRMGAGYAQGDVITENKLQTQIIQLQQTVINVLQDALYTGRNLTEADMQRLISAQQTARDGSLDALQGQYRRMLGSNPDRMLPGRKQLPDYNSPQRPGMLRRQSSLDSLEGPTPLQKRSTFPARRSSVSSARSLPPPRRADSVPAPPAQIFCRYSETLQDTSRPLHSAFDPSPSSSDSRCPTCDSTLPVDSRDVWVFSTDPTSNRTIEYRMSARFVVKCHTPDGRFGCVLCARQRDRDADVICRTVDGLIQHMATKHGPDEFDGDVDLKSEEVRVERKTIAY